MSPIRHLRITGLLAIVLAIVFAGFVAGARAAPPAQFTVVDLGTFGGTTSAAFAISPSGQVVGESRNAWGYFRAFSWTEASGMVDLGTLAGDSPGFSASARAVSQNGQVVGWSSTADYQKHAFSWTPAAGMVDLGAGEAIAVTPSGQVVIQSGNRAFSWTQAGGRVDLGTLGGPYTFARAVSPSGQVVGWSYTPGGTRIHAFSWTQTGGMIDLGTFPGGEDSAAHAINPSGQIVGGCYTPHWDYHAFSWTQAGGMIDLGTLPGEFSWAIAVTPSGQVIGNTSYHAFSWTPDGGMVNLGSIGGNWAQASAVSPSGQVVGQSLTADGRKHAFSWTQAGGMIDLGTLPPDTSDSAAAAVNENGQVAGSAGFYGHAAFWEPVPTVSVSGHGRFGTEGNSQVTFTFSNDELSLDRIRGQRFTFTGEVESVTGEDKTATLTGTGVWNGQGGYAFEVLVVDKGGWGRLEDTIDVVIRDPAGSVVFTSFGPQVLKQGDISVTTAATG